MGELGFSTHSTQFDELQYCLPTTLPVVGFRELDENPFFIVLGICCVHIQQVLREFILIE